MTAQQKQAVKTAGDRLESIERWSKATYYSSVVSAAALIVVALVIVYGAYEYHRVKTSISDYQQSIVKDLDKMQDSLKFPSQFKESSP